MQRNKHKICLLSFWLLLCVCLVFCFCRSNAYSCLWPLSIFLLDRVYNVNFWICKHVQLATRYNNFLTNTHKTTIPNEPTFRHVYKCLGLFIRFWYQIHVQRIPKPKKRRRGKKTIKRYVSWISSSLSSLNRKENT